MKKVGLIFPHQLYKESKVVRNCDVVYIIEEYLYFTQYKFHKQKLVLHRASMKYYADLISSDTTVKYIQSNDYQGIGKIFESLKKNEVHCYLTDDYLLERRINRYAKKHAVQLERYTNPNFINPENEVRDMLSKKKNYFMASFYAESRKKHGILIENGDKPLGGKWSFDADNRKKVPKGTVIPKVKTPNLSNYIDEAKEYVEDQFALVYGNVRRCL